MLKNHDAYYIAKQIEAKNHVSEVSGGARVSMATTLSDKMDSDSFLTAS